MKPPLPMVTAEPAELLAAQQQLDIFWMQYALQLADKAEQAGEIPVGAVLVKDNQVLGEGWNLSICQHDPSAHAEMLAIRQAAAKSKTTGCWIPLYMSP